jgi:tRNA(Ile2) C34 agmatinyltransferase TiaS
LAAYRCPKCGLTAEIDLAKRVKRVVVPYDRERPGFPRHGDCELAKSLDQMDLKKLEEVR